MAAEPENITLTSNHIATIVLLLRSAEPARHLDAIHYLDQYASESNENCEKLFQHSALESVLLHLLNPHRFIRRFALRIVAKMFTVSAARAKLNSIANILNEVRINYCVHDDDVLNESAAQILKELSQSEAHLKTIIGDNMLHDHLFRRITSTTDPDVLYQSVELLRCIVGHSDGLKAMCSEPNATRFPFAFMVATATQNEFPCVQISALQCLCILADCHSEPYVTLFSDPAFMEQILRVLDNFVWFDLHDDTIRLLRQTLRRDVQLVQRFLSVRFMEYTDTTPHHRLAAIGVLTQLAENADALPALFQVRFTDYLLDSLRTTSTAETVQGIAYMAIFEPARLAFVDANVVRTLIERLDSAEVQLDDQCTIANCLSALFELDVQMCEQAVDGEGLSIVADLLVDRCTSTELRRSMVEMLSTLARRPLMKKRVMTDTMAKGLYYTFRKADKLDDFAVDLLGCLAQYMSEQTLRDELISMDSCSHLIECLQLSVNNMLPLLLKASNDWLLVCCKYIDMCDMFIDQHLLDFLIAGAADLTTCPPCWPVAIEAILANNLPVKFAMRGHLNLNDRTGDDFYATHKIWRNYARLRQIVANRCDSRRPIYLCSFADDAQLLDLLRIVQEALAIDRVLPADDAPLSHAADIRLCVQHLANTVCNRLCSRSQCSPDEHLADLKRTTYHRNVIPLGALRMGGLMEKALLFKVLADRVGLPCVLHMDAADNRLVWPEVALPVYDDDDFDDAFVECGEISKVALLDAPTHVVDLMEEPGKLYLIDSAMAHRYLTITVDSNVDDSINCI